MPVKRLSFFNRWSAKRLLQRSEAGCTCELSYCLSELTTISMDLIEHSVEICIAPLINLIMLVRFGTTDQWSGPIAAREPHRRDVERQG